MKSNLRKTSLFPKEMFVNVQASKYQIILADFVFSQPLSRGQINLSFNYDDIYLNMLFNKDLIN